MKKLTLILGLMISVGLLFSSCKKSTDEEEILDPAPNGTGSYSMTFDGNTFSTLQDELNMVYGVIAFAGLDHNNNEFVITLSNVPSIGSTINICHEEDCGENPFGLIYMADEGNFYTAYEGTVSRPSEKKIEISGKLTGFGGEFHDFSLTININVILVR